MTVRYSWWGAEERAKKIDRMTALSGKKRPKIKVRTDFPAYQPFCEKLRTQAVGGNPRDVFQNAVAFLRKYDKRGIRLDLKSQVRQGDLSLDHFRAASPRAARPTASGAEFPSVTEDGLGFGRADRMPGRRAKGSAVARAAALAPRLWCASLAGA
ncbi:hypothetical protein ACWDU8_06065 [Streptomyces sp. NPDC003388]